MASEIKCLTISELLDRTPIGKRTLYYLWKHGNGPARIRIGRRVFVTERAAEDWLFELYKQSI